MSIKNNRSKGVLKALSQSTVFNLARSKILAQSPKMRNLRRVRIMLYKPSLYGITQIPRGASLREASQG